MSVQSSGGAGSSRRSWRESLRYTSLTRSRRAGGRAFRLECGHPGEDADVEIVWDGEWTVVVLSNHDAPAGTQLAAPIVALLAKQTALAGTTTGSC